MSKALENGRAAKTAPLPHAGVERVLATEMPEFYSGCFGLGSRDLQPGDIIAAVENMLPDGAQRRQFYLGIDFLRPATRLPKLQIWQEQLRDAYPKLERAVAAERRQREPAPDGIGGGAHPLRGRVGRDHDGKESRGDGVRPAPPRDQGESEVRLGEEGAAHDVLRDVRARADPSQLRAEARRRRAVAGSERLPSLESARRPGRRRRVRAAERSHARRCWAALPASAQREIIDTEDPRISARRVRDRRQRGVGRRAALSDAGRRVHGRVLRRVAARGTARAWTKRSCSPASANSCEEVRQARRARGRRQPARHRARVSRADAAGHRAAGGACGERRARSRVCPTISTCRTPRKASATAGASGSRSASSTRREATASPIRSPR